MDALIVLLIITLLGLISKNSTVWIAGAFLLLIKIISTKVTFATDFLQWVEVKGLRWGIIILTIGVLSSVAVGKVGLQEIWQTSKSYLGWAAILVGIFVAYLGGKGVGLLSSRPEIMTGLLIGTIIGVAIFRGVPVGPLIAAGLLAFISNWLK